MKNFMNAIKMNMQKKNVFDLTHDVKMSAKFGFLYPTLVAEMLPGETFMLGCDSLVRFEPMVFPTMHRYRMRHQYFFVPNRICWDNWEKFITASVGDLQTNPAHPYFTVAADGSNYTPLMDYMGVPPPNPGAVAAIDVNAIPFFAYHKIWDTYYRQDQIIPDLETELGQKTLNDGSNGADLIFLGELRRCANEHDYFTSCLPTPQAGAPIEIPIVQNQDIAVRRNVVGGGLATWNNDVGGGVSTVTNTVAEDASVGANELFVDDGAIDNTTTIEDLRRASAIQRFFERLMRTGRRYKEVLLAAFGTDGGDARLQRPEFVFSVQSPVVISEVLNTSDTADAPQGALAGHGVGVNNGGYGKYTSKEHGYMICMTSVIPMTGYQQGLPAHLHRHLSPYNYFWNEFANLGEDAVKNLEIFAYTATDQGTFGYLPRYSRYRTIQNRVCGQFRTTKASFHHGRIFAGLPTLSESFIECNPGKRIFAVTEEEEDELNVFIVNHLKAIRPVPKFGTPTLQ